MANQETIKFWKHVREVSKEVAEWPEWKRGGLTSQRQIEIGGNSEQVRIAKTKKDKDES